MFERQFKLANPTSQELMKGDLLRAHIRYTSTRVIDRRPVDINCWILSTTILLYFGICPNTITINEHIKLTGKTNKHNVLSFLYLLVVQFYSWSLSFLILVNYDIFVFPWTQLNFLYTSWSKHKIFVKDNRTHLRCYNSMIRV